MRKRKKVVYIASLVSFFLTILVIGFLKRDVLLNYLLQSKVQKIERNKDIVIHYDQFQWKGWNEIVFNDISIVPNRQDTLMKATDLKVKISIFDLWRNQPAVRQITGSQIELNFVKDSTQCNYAFLFSKKRKEQTSSGRDYGRRVHQMVNIVFNLLPPHAALTQVSIHGKHDGREIGIEIPDFYVTEGHFSTLLRWYESGEAMNLWRLHGELHPARRSIQANLEAAEGGLVRLPGMDRWEAGVSFESISFALNGSRNRGWTELAGHAEVKKLTIRQPDLSSAAVRLDAASLHYHFQVEKEAIELGKGSTLQVNQLNLQPSVRMEQGKNGSWHFTIAIDKPFFPATQLFSSLPEGLFDTLHGIQVEGELAWHFLLDLDFSHLDSLRFESEMKSKDFRIIRFGKEDLTKLNRPFQYTAYEKGQPVRTFEVGPGYAGFVPLEQISPLLQHAVLQSEDGSFFDHKGFRMDALQEALIHDFEVKHFARGGSTISMQLVKNVFLNRNKNLFRKLEEALIVWLIENQGLSSKQRMFEVYLNIIEWGPLLYGAREASRYYFSKEPSQLTAEEAIFLASIIPAPKRYRSSFTPEGELKPWLTGYFHKIAHLMARSGLLTEEQADSVKPSSVRLTGPAGREFIPLPSDSLSLKTVGEQSEK